VCPAVQLTVLTMSLGYFVYDTICCLIIDFDVANLMHHLCTILGLVVGVVQAKVTPCKQGRNQGKGRRERHREGAREKGREEREILSAVMAQYVL
jgi:hypothetical protein